MTFKPPNHSNLKIKVTIHYEIFDDVPIMTKYLTVEALEPLSLGFGPLEILSLNWQWSDQGYKWLQVLPDLPRGTQVKWRTEPNKELGSFQPLLEVGYNSHFELPMKSGDVTDTFKVLEVLVGSSDPERRGLSLKR